MKVWWSPVRCPPKPSFFLLIPNTPSRPLPRPVTCPRLPVITHHSAHKCLRHMPAQSNFHLVQQRSFHVTPGIFHPKREESANRCENGGTYCIVLGWFFKLQNSKVTAPRGPRFGVLMPSPSTQFFASADVPKSKYPENDVTCLRRGEKKYCSGQKLGKTVQFVPRLSTFSKSPTVYF